MALFDQITIVGMGLIGGSVGIAAKKKKAAKNVVGLIRNKAYRAAILKAGAADKVSLDPARAVKGSDLVVLAVPVSSMESCAKSILPYISADCLLTDAGSVKGPVVDTLERIFANKGLFVGSHPIAGSEKNGIEAARGDLFQKALCILTPTSHTDPKALARVQKFWQALGSRTCLASAQDHDRIMAAVSHLPHLLAACLMHSARKAGEGFEDPLKFIGPGFRDMTRIAAGAPALWADILVSNRTQIARAATVYIERLEEIKEVLHRHDREALLAFLSQAKEQREKI